ncbi:hypothetical protein [Streptomyces cadmiisoli]|uniref:hypothetical protein n=1 Tax=Streptomyces cadmiisoli TaxID=2184053 RepID=UPI0036545617
MITIATARSYGRLDDTTAGDLARCWNAAYPIMRKLVTRKIDGDRRYIAEHRWDTATGSPEVVFDVPAPTEAAVRRSLHLAEALRRTLGQLDRGTHRPCTRSPQGFSVTSAYWAVRDVLPMTGINDRDLSDLYQLASLLAYISDGLARQRDAEHATA